MAKNNLPLAYIELSKNNLIHNIKQFRKLAKKGTRFSVVVKGNAYGHGQNEVVKILEPYADYFQVNSVFELKLLRKVSKKKTFVFGYVGITDLLLAQKLGCILSIFSIEQLREVDKIAKKLKIKQDIHLPVDAYLGREGFLLQELPKVFAKIKKCKFIRLSGIYAHFANIEDTPNFSHAQKQIKEYQNILRIAEEYGFDNLQTHISATSGLLAYEKSKGVHPLVRLGIGVYGIWPSEYLKSLYKKTNFKLRPVLAWKTRIAQIKILPKGHTIGYGLTYQTKKETKVAVVPQGYADGLDRGFSNNGHVLIAGSRCKILGRVMMNMVVVDINHLKDVNIEDEVVILGRQGKEEITAEEMAKLTNTVNYEIITRTSSLLPRVII
jgi:alanine racemase